MGLQEPRSQEGAPGEVEVGFASGWLDGLAGAMPAGEGWELDPGGEPHGDSLFIASGERLRTKIGAGGERRIQAR